MGCYREHTNFDHILEGEQHESIPTNSSIQTDVFHDMNDIVSNAGKGSETDEMFDDAPLDFDPSYPLMDKST